MDHEFRQAETEPAPWWLTMLCLLAGALAFCGIMSQGGHANAKPPYGELRRDMPPATGCGLVR